MFIICLLYTFLLGLLILWVFPPFPHQFAVLSSLPVVYLIEQDASFYSSQAFPCIISVRCYHGLCFSILGNIFLTSNWQKYCPIFSYLVCVCMCAHTCSYVCTKTVCMCVCQDVMREQFLEVSPPLTMGLRYPTQIFTLAVQVLWHTEPSHQPNNLPLMFWSSVCFHYS